MSPVKQTKALLSHAGKNGYALQLATSRNNWHQLAPTQSPLSASSLAFSTAVWSSTMTATPRS